MKENRANGWNPHYKTNYNLKSIRHNIWEDRGRDEERHK
jgi:hypothetical protein